MPVSEPRILIVEDESVVAADLKERLTELKYMVVAITDTGVAAIAHAGSLRPDLVLMDIRLRSGMDGIEAANLILRDLDIPVVYLTAHADESTLRRARESGPFGYVVKPFETRELRTAIEIALERHAIESRAKRAERLLAATLRSIGEAVIATDAAGRITFMNPVAEQLTGFDESAGLGRDLSSVFLIYDPATRQPIQSPLIDAIKSGQTVKREQDKTLIAFGGVQHAIDDSCAPILDEHGRVIGGILVFRDVTERSRQRAEREQLIAELQDALANLKTLNGLLPICGWCKKIRDDRGYWERVETYVQKHSRAEFTHSICPECYAKMQHPGGA